MTSLRHGSLSIDLPDDWRDQSTLLFVNDRGASGSEAVGIRLVAADSRSADAILDHELTLLGRADEDVRVTDRGPLRGGLGEGSYREYRVMIGERPLRQLFAIFVVGSVAVLANASAAEADYPGSKNRFMQIFSSLRTTAP